MVEIFIGSPVEHESERSTLREIERVLAAGNCPAVVFANFGVLSRQIDFLVASDGLTLVIEAKSRTRAVRGGENGPWQVHVGSGDWIDFPNPYHQVLGAALALKDAMRGFSDGPVPYVAAALVFAPDIPRGSQILQSDRKVSVMGHDGLRGRLWRRARSGWTVAQWRAFSQRLGLTRVSSIATACDPVLMEAENHIREYGTNFCRIYRDAESLVPFGCKSEEESFSSSDVTDLVLEHGRGLLLRGPSGCGSRCWLHRQAWRSFAVVAWLSPCKARSLVAESRPLWIVRWVCWVPCRHSDCCTMRVDSIGQFCSSSMDTTNVRQIGSRN